VRVLILALSTYTSAYNRAKLTQLSRRVDSLDVVTGDLATLWGPAAPATAEDEYRLHILRPWIGISPALAALNGVTRIANALRPDLVHIEAEPWQLVAVQGVVTARRLGVPVGVMFAENGPALTGVDGLARKVAARRVLRRCTYAVGWAPESTAVARDLGGSGLITATIPGTGVDLRSVSEQLGTVDQTSHWFGADADGVGRVAFAGRLEPEKGLADALTVCDRLASEVPIRVAIAGRGSMTGMVREWAAAREWACFHGLLDRPQVSALFGCADVVLFPSRRHRRWSEQLGKGAVEAMAVGTPVVAYDSGALSHVVDGGGTTVAEGATDELAAAALRFIVSSPDVRRAARQRARVRARDFGEDVLADRLVALWLQVLTSSGGHA
jgi:glycosyltransferase involved in cell wall biosynthesis